MKVCKPVQTVVLCLLLMVAAGSEPPLVADRVLIVKSSRTMTLLRGGSVFKVYKVALGGHPIGPKERQGDEKTPEGEYRIDSRTRTASFTWRCMSPIRMLQTASEPAGWAWIPEETS